MPFLTHNGLCLLRRKGSQCRPIAQILGTVSPIGDKIELTVTIVAREHYNHGRKRI